MAIFPVLYAGGYLTQLIENYSIWQKAGYLKVLKTMVGGNGNLLCEMDLPNREISIVYQKEIIIEETDEIVERDGI